MLALSSVIVASSVLIEAALSFLGLSDPNIVTWGSMIAEGRVPPGSIQTENSFGDRGWGGPCPPEGDEPHRYRFALYAVRRPLGLGEEASPDEVRGAVADSALARGTLTGRFGR